MTSREDRLIINELASGTLRARFEAKIFITETCHLWTGSLDGHGYGQISAGGHKSYPCATHRVSWIINHGPIPDGLLVLHRCDNPPCVWDEHLFLGTSGTNAQDCVQKRRSNRKCLSPEDVASVRELLQAGLTQTTIAECFGVTHRVIGRIKAGTYYQWVS